MELLDLPSEILQLICHLVTVEDGRSSSAVTWNSEELRASSISLSMLNQPLAQTCWRLRDLTLWTLLSRPNAAWLHLWSHGDNIWQRRPSWYGACRQMARRQWPSVALWTRVVLDLNIPWRNPRGDIGAIVGMLDHMVALKHLVLHIDLVGERNSRTRNYIPPMKEYWATLVRKLNAMHLLSIEIQITTRLVSTSMSCRWPVVVSDLRTYNERSFPKNIILRSRDFRVKIRGCSSPETTLRLFEGHLEAIYRLIRQSC